MPSRPPSAKLRTLLRKRIAKRTDGLRLTPLASHGGLASRPPRIRLGSGEDLFSLDRLVNTIAAIGLVVRMTAARPAGRRLTIPPGRALRAHPASST